jgi:hypothetical protein
MPARLLLAVLAASFLGLAADSPQVVGIAVEVKRQVLAFPLSGEHSHELEAREPVERGLKAKLVGDRASLKIAFTKEFGCKPVEIKAGQAVPVSGVITALGKGEIQVGDPGSCEPKVYFTTGNFWLALASVDLPVLVETLHAILKPHGTYLRVLVDPTVGTFVAVDEGTVTVQAKAGGEPVEVRTGDWVLVPPGGWPTRPGPRPRGLDEDDFPVDPPLLGCCPGTEPPKPPPL